MAEDVKKAKLSAFLAEAKTTEFVKEFDGLTPLEHAFVETLITELTAQCVLPLAARLSKLIGIDPIRARVLYVMALLFELNVLRLSSPEIAPAVDELLLKIARHTPLETSK